MPKPSRHSNSWGIGLCAKIEDASGLCLNSTETMKEFKLPQRLEDLENGEGNFFSATSVIDLESCDADNCMEMLGSDSSNLV